MATVFTLQRYPRLGKHHRSLGQKGYAWDRVSFPIPSVGLLWQHANRWSPVHIIFTFAVMLKSLPVFLCLKIRFYKFGQIFVIFCLQVENNFGKTESFKITIRILLTRQFVRKRKDAALTKRTLYLWQNGQERKKKKWRKRSSSSD